MSKALHCDGPHCDTWTKDPYIFITIKRSDVTEELHFCLWDCVLRYSAQFEPTEVEVLEVPD